MIFKKNLNLATDNKYKYRQKNVYIQSQ